ncbi:MAG: hypothetical protein M3439_01935 [Chloroflexota bacterium]|nr:hypothetical protein [Chloroflexota bacterium]
MRLRSVNREHRTGAFMRAVLNVALATVASVILFAGCASVRFGSTFTEDNTATHTLEVTVPRASMNALDLARVERQIADAEINARSGGLTTARIDNPETLGIRVINTTQDATDAGLALNSIFNTLVNDSTTGPVAPFQGTYERVSEAVGGNSFKLSLTVDGDLLYAAAARVAPGHPQFSTPNGVREVVRIEYQVTMPGEITDTNGGLRGQSSVIWTIPLEGPTLLEARSTVGKDTPWLWTVLTIAGAFLVVGVTAAMIWKLLLARRRAGRMRFPLGLRQRRGNVRPATNEATRPPGSLREVRASLAGLVRRVLNGERLDARQARAALQRAQMEESSRGADAEGD